MRETRGFYNLFSWEKGFGIRYWKSRSIVESIKFNYEIVCRYVVSFISLRHISVFGQCVGVCELSSEKHFFPC